MTLRRMGEGGGGRRVHTVGGGTKSKQKEYQTSLLLLGSIVMVYLCCNIPRLVLNLAEVIAEDDMLICEHAPKWTSILLGVSHLSLTLNSSVNFLIYFSLGKKFKTVSKRYGRRLTHRLGSILAE